jgi:hypothetical protein
VCFGLLGLPDEGAQGTSRAAQRSDAPAAIFLRAALTSSSHVLLVLPKIGSVKAGRILADCGIAHSKTLGGLTERQRTELMNRFHRDGHDK